MKKLAIAICLVGILVGSAMGSMALADKGGDPNLGSSTLGEINEKASTIMEGVGDVTDRLDNPDWGLQEIKREVAAIEGNVTGISGDVSELKEEIASIKSDVDKLMTCSPSISIYSWGHSSGDFHVDFDLYNKGILTMYDVELRAYFDGVHKVTKRLDVLDPGIMRDLTLEWSATPACSYHIEIVVSGFDPWSGSVSYSRHINKPCIPH